MVATASMRSEKARLIPPLLTRRTTTQGRQGEEGDEAGLHRSDPHSQDAEPQCECRTGERAREMAGRREKDERCAADHQCAARHGSEHGAPGHCTVAHDAPPGNGASRPRRRPGPTMPERTSR